MALTIDELNIEIEASATQATSNLDNLVNSLIKLEGAASKAKSLSSVAKAINSIATSSSSLKNVNFTDFKKNTNSLADALKELNGVKGQIGATVNSLAKIKDVSADLGEAGMLDSFGESIKTLCSKLEPLGNVSSKLGNTLNGLSKVGDASRQLESALGDGSFIENINKLALALGNFASVGNIKIGTTVNNLRDLLLVFEGTDVDEAYNGVNKLANALSGFSMLGQNSFGSIVGNLKKIPEIAKEFQTVDLDAFVQQVERLNIALKPLAENCNKISAGFARLPQRTKQVVTAFEQVNDSANKTAKSTSKFSSGFRSLTGTLGRVYVLYYAFKKVANMMGDWFNASNDYIENMNLFSVSMGSAAKSAYEYAEKVSEMAGINVSDWMTYQGTFQNLATGFGVASDKAAIMSQNLTQLSYDLSSFFNCDVETAFDKLSSAMSGQVKGLREFGINTTVATMEQYMLEKGINATWNSLDQASQSLIRYNYILETSKKLGITNDLARTINTPSNALRILNAQLDILERNLGAIVSVFVTRLIPWVQAFVKLMVKATQALYTFFGFSYDDYMADLSGLSSGGISDEFSDMSDSFSDGASSAKEIRKQLMGFDEINILNNPNKSNGSSGIGGVAGGVDLSGLNLEQYDFLAGLEGFDTSEMEATISRVTAILSGALLAIGGILFFGTTRKLLGLGLMAAGVTGLGLTIAANWDGMSDKLKDAIGKITAILSGALLAIGAILVFTGVNVPLGLGMMAYGAVGLVAVASVKWGGPEKEIDSVLNGIELVVSGALLGLGAILAFTGNLPLGIALLASGAVGLVAALAVKWGGIKTPIDKVIKDITLKVSASLLALGAILLFSGVATPLGFAFLAAGAVGLVASVAMNWNYLKKNIKNILDNIFSIVSGASLALGMILCLTGVGLPIGLGLLVAGAASAFASAKISGTPLLDKVRSICNGVISIVERMINFIVRQANKLSFTVPDWVLGIGGDSWGFNLSTVSIPRLAEGGIVNAGQMFIAREAGPELVGKVGTKNAVINNEQIVQAVANGVYKAVRSAMGEQGGGSGDTTIRVSLEMDGTKMTEKVVKYHNRIVKKTGSSPLLV